MTKSKRQTSIVLHGNDNILPNSSQKNNINQINIIRRISNASRPFDYCGYQKVNAYSHRASKQQILTLLIVLIQLALHEVFVTPYIQNVNHSILWIILGFRYFLVFFIIYDYIFLTVFDPVDRLILDQKRQYKYSYYQLRNCGICHSVVQKTSYHCMSCNRCTQDFDHHCKYLNNCIGVRNYQNFIRLLIIYVIWVFVGIGMGIWVLVYNNGLQQAQKLFTGENQYKKWVIVGYLVLLGGGIGVVGSLLCFHLYISCCANMTTLSFIYHDNAHQPKINKNKQNSKQNQSQNTSKNQKYKNNNIINQIRIQHVPLSAQVFKKKKNYKYDKQYNQNQNDQYVQNLPQIQGQILQNGANQKNKQVKQTNFTQNFYQPMEYYRK